MSEYLCADITSRVYFYAATRHFKWRPVLMFDKVPKKFSRCIQRLLTLGITYSGTVFNLMFCCWCDPDKLYGHC